MSERDPDQDIIDEYERRIAAGTDFEGLIRVNARTPRNPRAVVSIRVAPDIFDLVASAAESRGVSVSEFFRDAAATEAARVLAEDAKDYSLAELQADIGNIKRRLDKAAQKRGKLAS